MQNSVQLNVAHCVLYFVNQVVSTSSWLGSPSWQPSDQHWRERPSAPHGAHLAPVGHARVYPGESVDLSRIPDAVLGLPTVGAFQASTQFHLEQWPAWRYVDSGLYGVLWDMEVWGMTVCLCVTCYLHNGCLTPVSSSFLTCNLCFLPQRLCQVYASDIPPAQQCTLVTRDPAAHLGAQTWIAM